MDENYKIQTKTNNLKDISSKIIKTKLNSTYNTQSKKNPKFRNKKACNS